MPDANQALLASVVAAIRRLACCVAPLVLLTLGISVLGSDSLRRSSVSGPIFIGVCCLHRPRFRSSISFPRDARNGVEACANRGYNGEASNILGVVVCRSRALIAFPLVRAPPLLIKLKEKNCHASRHSPLSFYVSDSLIAACVAFAPLFLRNHPRWPWRI